MPLTYRHHKLPNGLEIIAEINPAAHCFAAGVFVKAGSRDESPELNGVSHFLEHMMFKGSQQYSCEDMNRLFDEIGAQYNAFTTQEVTAYYARVLPEYAARVIEYLAMLLRPAFRQNDFEMEKQVILEEIAMCMDDPVHRLYERTTEEFFETCPLRRSVLGSRQTVSQLTRDQMEAYFHSHYGPGNMVVAVTGQMDFDEVVQHIARWMGDWPPIEPARRLTEVNFRPHTTVLSEDKLNRQYIAAMMPAPAAMDPRRFAASVLTGIVGANDSSRLYWALVDNAIAESADLSYDSFDGCGTFTLFIVTQPQRAQRAADIAHRELSRLVGSIDEQQLQRSKNQIASALVIEGESVQGRMSSIGMQWIYNYDYQSLQQDRQLVDAVTVESLHELMEQFPLDTMTTVMLGPPSTRPKGRRGR